MIFTQAPAGVRFEWGPAGAAVLAETCAVLVVVDVLSFSTSATVAVERGMRVHPFPWRGDEAVAFASRIGAVAAAGRSTGSAYTLSPLSLATAPVVPDLVLPSPNGSAICAAAASTGAAVVAGCARNAPAVASWLLEGGFGTAESPVGVVAAGERWPGGSLRPSTEDLLGAALILDGLIAAPGELSVEAAATVAVLTGIVDVPAAIHGCASGRELIAGGFAEDVDIAAAIGVSETVPVLVNGAFLSSRGEAR